MGAKTHLPDFFEETVWLLEFIEDFELLESKVSWGLNFSQVNSIICTHIYPNVLDLTISKSSSEFVLNLKRGDYTKVLSDPITGVSPSWV